LNLSCANAEVEIASNTSSARAESGRKGFIDLVLGMESEPVGIRRVRRTA
jgi:hypothetical protein